jgi:fluoroquinolone transport system ATP-binding protein
MIAVEHLRFRYAGAGADTLDDVSFEIDRGEVYGLLGPSGAGKSTVQRIVMGLLPGFTGRVEVLGGPIAHAGRSLYDRIGVGFELPIAYLRLTALENLRLFAALYNKPALDPMDVLAMVDLADDANRRVDQFSKGMRMRLNFARALLNDPDLIFLDEPTTGQDPARARVLRRLIADQKSRGKTIFLTTHNMAEAEGVCDRVGFLHQGRILVSGTPVELKRRFGQRVVEVTVSADGAAQTQRFELDGLADNQIFLSLLRSGEIVSIQTLDASLDDIFIETIGSSS